MTLQLRPTHSLVKTITKRCPSQPTTLRKISVLQTLSISVQSTGFHHGQDGESSHAFLAVGACIFTQSLGKGKHMSDTTGNKGDRLIVPIILTFSRLLEYHVFLHNFKTGHSNQHSPLPLQTPCTKTLKATDRQVLIA